MYSIVDLKIFVVVFKSVGIILVVGIFGIFVVIISYWIIKLE